MVNNKPVECSSQDAIDLTVARWKFEGLKGIAEEKKTTIFQSLTQKVPMILDEKGSRR